MDSVGTKHSLLVRQWFSYISNYITLRVLCFKGKQSLLIQAVRINCGSLILNSWQNPFIQNTHMPDVQHLWDRLGFQTLWLFNLLRLLKAEVQQGVCLNRNGLSQLYEKLDLTWLLLQLPSLFLTKSKWMLEVALLALCLPRRHWSSMCVL